MATIFLDTNILIDLYGRDKSWATKLTSHNLYVSTLSCHVLCYAAKIKIPDLKLNQLLKNMGIISIDNEVVVRSLQGPTDDLEDNLQLHACTNSKCQYFLTGDKLLLKLGYFGETAIVNHI